MRRNKLLAVLLLIALVLLYVPIPLIPEKTISAIMILGIAIYMLLK
jgi:hypothetical protein